ncbi:iron ABC transporter [Rhodococcus sp. 05-2254-6]|nr:iron ABC transporter [Rhodococcus sp. EPR-147]KZF10305.1 iron ABC transporter [Rhodococcus sp. EPR-279]OZE26101.1 iron ABC transporter [Rhodococcus sp. 05-2254-6]OZE31909.1 iron ABC transporter [Rhodococcus sp. 05-2254-4]OZE41911.1 iron ABC transporter [Rhodococcus sp. 05-2254-3]OZE52346.1 iron ABC transporter [Rhodococcus sp. 05-2254-2]OZF43712.1 iron ABC transporter [Rhodococcus sp. 14-1411-2a]
MQSPTPTPGEGGVRTRPAFRLGPISMVRRPLMVLTTVLLAAALVLVMCVNIGRGDFPLSIVQVLDVLLGGGSRIERFIVMDLRLPRSLTGLLVGAALGISGAITQSISRNALASPDILGITAGSSAAAVALIVLGGGSSFSGLLATLGLPLAALIGGLLTAIAIYTLAWRKGVDGFRLILVGIAVNAMLTAVIGWLLISADINDVSRAQVWLNGSLNGADWSAVWPVAIAVVLVGGGTVVATFTLGALRLGDDNARSLGVRLQHSQAMMLLAAVALAAIATAAAGPIGFVALAAPQIALRVLRTPGPPIIASALLGGLLVVASDLIARTILPVELPVGIVTSALGGPFLLYLLVRSNRKASV